MKVVQKTETNEISLDNITDQHYVVGKIRCGSEIFPVIAHRDKNEAWKFYAFKNGDYFGWGNSWSADSKSSDLKTQLSFYMKSGRNEFYAFEDWKDALMWLVKNG